MGMGPPLGMNGPMMMGPMGDFGPVRCCTALCSARDRLLFRWQITGVQPASKWPILLPISALRRERVNTQCMRGYRPYFDTSIFRRWAGCQTWASAEAAPAREVPADLASHRLGRHSSSSRAESATTSSPKCVLAYMCCRFVRRGPHQSAAPVDTVLPALSIYPG